MPATDKKSVKHGWMPGQGETVDPRWPLSGCRGDSVYFADERDPEQGSNCLNGSSFRLPLEDVPVPIGTDKEIPVGAKVFKVAALLAAAAAVALVGCKRAKHTSNPLAKAPVQAAPAAHAAPVGYVYITNNGEGTVSAFGRQADGSLDLSCGNFHRRAIRNRAGCRGS
jgi:hypothetical protein